jgi:hypothetical protein
MTEASEQLQKDLADALKLEMKAKDLAAQASKLKEKAYKELQEEGLLDPDTKAIGNVRLVISPNRFFSEAKALELKKNGKIPAAKIKQATVSKIDGTILKALLEPALYEECMADHEKKYKLGLKVND